PTWNRFSLTGSFVLFNFAAVALGPGPAAAIVVMSETGTFAFDRIRYAAAGFNIASAAIPAYLVGWIAGAPLSREDLSVYTLLVLAAASLVAMLVNAIFVVGMGWYEGLSTRSVVASLRGHFAIQLLTVPVLIGLVTTYLALGGVAAFLVPAAVLGVNYTVG